MFTTKTSEPDISKIPVVESINEFSKVLTDYGKALSNTSCFTKELIEPIKLPEGKTLIDVFKVCFDDNSTLLEQYHSDRKDTNQKWESWRPSLEGSPPFSGQRQFTCMTIIKALVAKVCPFTEYQRYAFMNIGGQEPTLLVQLSGQVEGVMFTDAFRVEALLVFSQTNSVVTMRAFGHVQFLRDVWVKGKILRTSLDTEMPDCYRKLGAMLIERLQQGGSGVSQEVKDQNGTNKTMPQASPLPTTTKSQNDELGSLSVFLKPVIYVEFIMEIICASFCVNAIIQTYFFTVPNSEIGMQRATVLITEEILTSHNVDQPYDVHKVNTLLVNLFRPLLIAFVFWLLYNVLFLMQETVMRMK